MTIRTDIPDLNSIECINNQYTKMRGAPKLYKILCEGCENLVLIYQKDGPGNLIRCYKDRIHYPKREATASVLSCSECKKVIGTNMIYIVI
ncbi:MAG TPA: hypothetical protein VGZ69_00880 [Candidatus Rhabdochlamydia sp.]|jgi:hypothetical protein|nr:hypothetical protein [Candidatus Rhabdochlamydia sp.]